jgi:hypothetical protein
MLILSAKARQLIDGAVAHLDPRRQRVWSNWSSAHPVPSGPHDVSHEPPPRDALDVVMAALEAQDAQLRQRLSDPNISEDDVSDLDNDLSHLRAVCRAIQSYLVEVARASA